MPSVLHFLSVLAYLSGVMSMTPPPTGPAWDPLASSGPFPQKPSYPMDPEYCQHMIESGAPQDQLPWFCVCSTCQSTKGPKGDRGDQGLPGPPGSPGRRGMTGSRGLPGFVGRPGIKGQKGDDGEKGSMGLMGLVGVKGARGFKGEKGQQGLEGYPGEQGPKGDDGVCPETCEATEGPPGPPGVPGRVGARGLPGDEGQKGQMGMKGDMGDMGELGPPGPVGAKGDQGPQGDCNCVNGTDGATGQKGEKGDSGEMGETGPGGETGSKGEKGEMGMMGMMGAPGPCMPAIRSAFSAALASSYPPPNAPVAFEVVRHNILFNYDPSTGLYTAPINGTYVFSYHLTVYSKVLVVGIFRNSVPMAITTNPAVLGTTSHSVVLHLARGDRVWIQVKSEDSNGMFAGSEASSTFNGFLLHPDTCDMMSLRSPMPDMTPPDGFPWPVTTPVPPSG